MQYYYKKYTDLCIGTYTIMFDINVKSIISVNIHERNMYMRASGEDRGRCLNFDLGLSFLGRCHDLVHIKIRFCVKFILIL